MTDEEFIQVKEKRLFHSLGFNIIVFNEDKVPVGENGYGLTGDVLQPHQSEIPEYVLKSPRWGIRFSTDPRCDQYIQVDGDLGPMQDILKPLIWTTRKKEGFTSYHGMAKITDANKQWLTEFLKNHDKKIFGEGTEVELFGKFGKPQSFILFGNYKTKGGQISSWFWKDSTIEHKVIQEGKIPEITKSGFESLFPIKKSTGTIRKRPGVTFDPPEPGNGHDDFHKQAVKMAGQGLPEYAIVVALKEINKKRANPHDEKDIERSVRDAVEYVANSSNKSKSKMQRDGRMVSVVDQKIPITDETPYCADCDEYILSIDDKSHYNHNTMSEGDRKEITRTEQIKDLKKYEKEKIFAKKAGTQKVTIDLIYPEDKAPELPPVAEIADQILEKHNFAVIRDDPKHLYHEEHNVYKPNGEAVLKEIIVNGIDEKYWKPSLANAIVEAVFAKSLHERDEFDKNGLIWNCKNGFVNVRTGEMVYEDIKSLIQIDTEFRPKLGRSELYETTTEAAIGEKNTVMLLEYMGSAPTYGLYHPHALICAVGDGDNGKSTIFNTYAKVLGNDVVSSEELQSIENDRFSAHNLEGKIANIATDIKSEELESTTTIKKLTTPGDMISVQAKSVQAHNADINTMMFFSCNELPTLPEWSKSNLGRLRVIPFTKTFKRDDSLVKDLLFSEERSRILNSLIFHLQNVIKNGFTYTQDIELVKELWQNHSDTATLFILTRLRPKKDNESHTTVAAVNTAYIEFCTKLQKPTKSNTQFNELMTKHNYEQFNTKINHEQTRCWRDITLIVPDEKQDSLDYTDHA